MRVLYLMTAPPPARAGTDAVIEEAKLLRSRFDGEMVFLLLSSRPPARFFRSLYGLRQLTALRRMEQDVDLHHIFHSELYFFPLLRFVRKPVVFTVASGLEGQRRLPPTRILARLSRIIVPSGGDLKRLCDQGYPNARVLPPAIDLSRFRPWPPPISKEFVLMAGSAPWTRKQFRTKGVDALLNVAKRLPFLRLVLLWRGILSNEIRERVNRLGLAERVEIVEEIVDVEQVLKRVHVAAVLADKPKLVKAFPHSLLEALACGRPVLASDRIPMSDYVLKHRCGLVVSGVDESDILRKIPLLRRDYETYQENARQVGVEDFALPTIIDAYRELYESVIDVVRRD